MQWLVHISQNLWYNNNVKQKRFNNDKEKLEFLLNYIREEKENKTPSNIILAGVEGRLEGMLENLQ